VSLDVLGVGEGIGAWYITVRVKHIDPNKLAQKVGSAAAALPIVDHAPEPALRAAMPFAAKLAHDDYGIDLEWQLSKAPPAADGLKENSGLGLGVGAGLGLATAGWLLWKLLLGHRKATP
jgi:hypothetical protein